MRLAGRRAYIQTKLQMRLPFGVLFCLGRLKLNYSMPQATISIKTLQKPIEAIHATPQQVVVEFAGAGSLALVWLHSVGGSSRTILEATDRYAAPSLVEAVGFEPDQFTSGRVARALATSAHIRAVQLTSPIAPVAGIGCTAAIATDRAKRGDHRCCLAISEVSGVTTYTLTFRKGHRTRQEEEQAVSLLILKAVARVCGVTGIPAPALAEGEALVEDFEPVALPERLVDGEFKLLRVTPDGGMAPARRLPHTALLSGAFNPLHQGHRLLAERAAELLGRPVEFELPLVNADKAAIGPVEARRRVAQFAGYAPVVLTCLPLFNQKAEIFPHSVFVIGIDTVKRLIEPRFYGHDLAGMRAALDVIRTAGCRFLVAGRVEGDSFLTLNDVELPAAYRGLFEQIPEELFRLDISSTAIRQGTGEKNVE